MISIVIPAHNAEKTIERCLESIFAQTYRDFEVIVVDDGSTDRTREIVDNFARRFDIGNSKLELIQQKNAGAQAARNRGFREIQCQISNIKYLLFCDADVVLREDCLEKMIRVLEEHPEASYAYSSFKFGWKKFKLWPFDAERLRKMPYIHTTSLIRKSVLQNLEDGPLVRRRTVLRISSGPFDESITRLQDWDLWLTMLEQGYTGVWIPEVLFQVINTKGTMSTWLPSFTYKIPKWLGFQPRAVARYNEAVARIKAKHNL